MDCNGHDLGDTSPAMRDDLGYVCYCFLCATFFRSVDDAELMECRPMVDPREELPR